MGKKGHDKYQVLELETGRKNKLLILPQKNILGKRRNYLGKSQILWHHHNVTFQYELFVFAIIKFFLQTKTNNTSQKIENQL